RNWSPLLPDFGVSPAAFGALRHLQVGKEVVEKEEVVSEDSSEVVIIEDGNEVKLDERKGLGLLIEERDLDRNGLESAMVSDGNVLHSTSLDREAYKDLIRSVEKKYSSKLEYLSSEIKSNEAKWHSLRSWRKQREEKKQEELKKPQEDLLREPFVPLTEDEESEINPAMANSNRRKILVTHENSNIQITGEVLQCLRPGAWLNDEVINVYLELLKERERREPKKYLNCHFFNTFFYKKVSGGRNGYDYKAVKRWTSLRKIGYKLSECDKIFIPIHKEVHWCLAVFNKKDKKFQYLDSLGGRDSQLLRVLGKKGQSNEGGFVGDTQWPRRSCVSIMVVRRWFTILLVVVIGGNNRMKAKPVLGFERMLEIGAGKKEQSNEGRFIGDAQWPRRSCVSIMVVRRWLAILLVVVIGDNNRMKAKLDLGFENQECWRLVVFNGVAGVATSSGMFDLAYHAGC
ncbi:ubiquitin-like-specific protease ESD4, partial [Silene latifolia]|uniref:ubiquitin-like-specific protease ESD4 n=1 Tax=Silene latifolia TaxID=37657 RepID=UPI003D77B26F